MTAGVEQLEFQAEARQLLDLMVHSVYSEKDSFLRELISNASDALDKLRIEAFRNKDLEVDTSDLHIEIAVEEDPRKLTVRDNGIGMTREEVVDLIGTLAKSGTAELRQKLRDAKNDAASEDPAIAAKYQAADGAGPADRAAPRQELRRIGGIRREVRRIHAVCQIVPVRGVRDVAVARRCP